MRKERVEVKIEGKNQQQSRPSDVRKSQPNSNVRSMRRNVGRIRKGQSVKEITGNRFQGIRKLKTGDKRVEH